MEDLCQNSVQNTNYPIDCLLFDLNDTLYSYHKGILEALERNIEEFLVQKCGYTEDKSSTIRLQLYRTYGTTLAGLQTLGFDIHTDDYHNFVHGRLPFELIEPDPQLQNLLRSIKQRKIVFTNSRRSFAIKIIERLGLEDCFDEIICFETLNQNLLLLHQKYDDSSVVRKPSIEAMKIAIAFVKVDDPHRVLFLDDDELNIAAGKAMGFQTVLVGKQVRTKEADYVVEKVGEIKEMVPGICYKELGSQIV